MEQTIGNAVHAFGPIFAKYEPAVGFASYGLFAVAPRGKVPEVFC